MVALSKDLALGLVILAGVSVYLTQKSGEASHQRSDQVMTAQLAYFNREAAKFVQANATTIEQAIVTAGRPVSYNAETLQAQGYLPTFKTSNLYGQQFCLAVRRVAAGSIEAMTATTGGTAIPPDRASNIAADVRSGSGGSVQPENTSIAVGGSWSMTLSDYSASGCAPSQGRLAGNLAFEEGRAITSSYAHRMPVTGMSDSATFRQSITLDNTCDDQSTPTVETNAPCGLRATGLSSNESGFEVNRMRMINSLISRDVALDGACDPAAATYGLSATGQALICAAGGTWQPVPAQASLVIWF